MVNYKEITSITNNYIKELTKLKDKKYSDLSDVFIVEGKHLVEEAYKHGQLVKVLSTDENLFYNDTENIKVTNEIIKKLSDTVNPQNVFGLVKKFEKDFDIKKCKSVLILDGISDPGNLGTIIRTSAGIGIDLIVMSENSVDLYNTKVIRATQGAIFSIKIIRTDIKKFIDDIKKGGFYIYGSALKNSINLKEAKKQEKYAIVLGNEAQGVRQEVLDVCDQIVKIEITDNVESLNVAIAGAILMYYFKI